MSDYATALATLRAHPEGTPRIVGWLTAKREALKEELVSAEECRGLQGAIAVLDELYKDLTRPERR